MRIAFSISSCFFALRSSVAAATDLPRIEELLTHDLAEGDVCVGYFSDERYRSESACARMVESDEGLSPSRSIVYPEWVDYIPALSPLSGSVGVKGYQQAYGRKPSDFVGRQIQFDVLQTPENFDLPEGMKVKGVSWLDHVVIRDDFDVPMLYSLSPSLSAKDRVTVLLLPDCTKKPLDQIAACTKKNIDDAKRCMEPFLKGKSSARTLRATLYAKSFYEI